MKLKEPKKTLQQIADETNGPERCQKGNPCKWLRMALNFSDSRRGLTCALFITMKTGATCRRYVYHGGDFKQGIRINYCPFCGKRAPTVEEPRAGDVVTEPALASEKA